MKDRLQALVRDALHPLLAEAGAADAMPDPIVIEDSRDPAHGDYACNVAMVLARPLKQSPRKIAEALVARLPTGELVQRVEIAGPGFINFFIDPAARQDVVRAILAAGEGWGRDDSGARGRVLVEFVSANPTGPMHVGHGRNAAYGDALARLLAAAGWNVDREYYVNDAGRQVDVLTTSCWLRYLQALGETVPFPSRGYPGSYLVDTAQHLVEAHGDAFRVDTARLRADLPIEPGDDEPDADARKRGQELFLDALIVRAHELLGDAYPLVRDFALGEQLTAIRDTLARFQVEFERWASERDIVGSGAAGRALEKLREGGHVYEQEGALWLRTSALGDEKDRVLYKRDGAATYFANDLAYHEDKLERGYDRLIDIWGADHHGYIGRVRAAIEALTGRPDALDVKLIQFVTLSSGRMGKRSGNFVTFNDLIAEVGSDAVRFFYLMRSHDQHLEFDLELARSQSNDNPVYYVQYAHARICSVFRQAAEAGIVFDPATVGASLHRLSEPQESHLLALLARYPEVVRNAADQAAPHQMAHALRDLADALHSEYNANKCLVEDAELRTARLALMAATRQVLANGLALLGVSAPEQM
jgi:arginyl-tRNA synthetase